MLLLALALIGKNNEPLYLCDCTKILADAKHGGPSPENTGTGNNNEQIVSHENDPLGIVGITSGGGLKESLGFEHRLIIHAALDQLEESIDTTDVGLPVPKDRTGASLGVLSKTNDDMWVHGYITATNIKILVLAHASAKVVEIRNFMSKIHDFYVEVSPDGRLDAYWQWLHVSFTVKTDN